MSKANDGRWGLTRERLSQVMGYDPETGLFTRLINTANRPVGEVAGTLKSSGYILLDIDGHRYRAHRLAWLYMTGAWPSLDVDHRNRVRSDNRWDNLREATCVQNGANSPKKRFNRSGYKGVYWNKQRGKWAAKINPNRKQVHLGFYDRVEDAAAAYERAAPEYFGEFARAA